MKGHNLMIDPGRRRCRACFMARMHGKPMTAETMDRLKNAIKDGTPLAEFLHGKPLGGGRKDRSLVITTPAKFYHQREIDPEFASLVDKHITTSNVVGQLARRVRCGHKKQKTDAALSPEMRPTVIRWRGYDTAIERWTAASMLRRLNGRMTSAIGEILYLPSKIRLNSRHQTAGVELKPKSRRTGGGGRHANSTVEASCF